MKQLRIGIFGGGRGTSFAEGFLLCNHRVVALCERNEKTAAEFREKFGKDLAIYEDFDKFLNHGLDAVVLCNFFNEHAKYAIRCLERGIHVLSECTAAGTMAEAVALVRAAEKSKAIYMLAENYPFMLMNTEMKRVCDGGTLGKFLYAEGEYNHPFQPSEVADYRPFAKHWRNYLPRTYYITHSLAPLMYMTGATPRRVAGLPVYAPFAPTDPVPSPVADRAAIITTLNDDDSVFRVTGCAGFGAHGNSYRICGTKGQIENLRGMKNKISLRYNAWDIPEDREAVNLYDAEWHDSDEELIRKTGHGGGDFIVCRTFLECLREGKKPPFDVYFATTLSSVAILSHRSILQGGIPYDVPDFHDEEARRQYENDTATPFWGENGEEPTIPACSHPDYAPTPEMLAGYEALVEAKRNS